MSSDVVIGAQGLGKKYVIGHRSNDRHATLRETLGRTAGRLGHGMRDMLRGRPIVAGDSTEEFWALQDVNFEIRRGDVVGVIGRNGAGKSTLLKILSRITEPSTGRVEIKGRVASLLEVGTGFHPELTGRENIYLNGAILGMSRAEVRRKFDEIVDFAGVEKFLDTPVKRYSSGMYVRLAFSVAAHLEPEILIVDEVLSVGDAEFQGKCLGKMENVAGEGRTVLFVSHNMAAVRKLCSRGMLFDKGSLLIDADVDNCLTGYSGTLSLENTSIENFPRNLNTDSRIRLIDIEQKNSPVQQDGDLSLDILIRITEPIKDVIFGIGFCNLDGGRLLSSDSDYAGYRGFEFGKPGLHRISIRIPRLPLAAGEYMLDVGCRTSAGRALDNVAMARVIPVELSQTSTLVHGKGYRTALVPGEWHAVAEGGGA